MGSHRASYEFCSGCVPGQGLQENVLPDASSRYQVPGTWYTTIVRTTVVFTQYEYRHTKNKYEYESIMDMTYFGTISVVAKNAASLSQFLIAERIMFGSGKIIS